MHEDRDLIGLVQAEAQAATEPRTTALRALADYLVGIVPDVQGEGRLRDPYLLTGHPEVRAIVDGYGYSGPGAEASFVEAVLATIGPPNAIERFAALPRWSVLTWWTYPLALFRAQRTRCPHCAERIRREARVCSHCGRQVTPSA